MFIKIIQILSNVWLLSVDSGRPIGGGSAYSQVVQRRECPICMCRGCRPSTYKWNTRAVVIPASVPAPLSIPVVSVTYVCAGAITPPHTSGTLPPSLYL
jgi:hypothetical protein